jgi:GMP synthase (glutamine-hydrolysing)
VCQVLVLVSGGVDSTVCGCLLTAALGKEKVISVHVDHGFMRLDESAKVEQALKQIDVDLKVRKNCQAHNFFIIGFPLELR